MKEIDLCQNGMTVKLIKRTGGLQLTVTTSDHPEAIACFPTEAALLVGVANGYSYQVASPEGSLTVSANAGMVSLSFDGGAIGTKRCRIDRHEFERAVHDLHNE